MIRTAFAASSSANTAMTMSRMSPASMAAPS
jgi:hypothetical protein